MKSLDVPSAPGDKPRSVTAMSFLRRVHAAVSLYVVAARIGTSPSTLRLWAEVGVGPTPDHRGVYQHDVVAAWLTEMEFACAIARGPWTRRFGRTRAA